MNSRTVLILILLLCTLVKADESLDLHILGASLHGLAYDHTMGEHFRYKFDRHGYIVYHPEEFTATYRNDSYQVTAMFFYNSFHLPSKYLGAGPTLYNGEYFNLGVQLGAYIYKIPVNFLTRNMAVGGSYLTPIALITPGVRIPVSNTFGLSINCGTNIFLTHCSTGVNMTW